MITLDATTKTLEIDLTSTVTTNQLPFVASYIDVNNSTFAMTAMGEQDGTSNNTTAVTCLSAPGATTSRVLKFFSWKNSDTVAREGWLQLNNNSTLREIWKGTLQVNDTLFLVDGANYKVIDANGNTKETVGTVPTSIILGTTTNDNAAAGRLGEVITNTAAAASVSLTTATVTNITSISLTAGDWDVWGMTSHSVAATTNVVNLANGITTTSATYGAFDSLNSIVNIAAGLVYGGSGATLRIPAQALRLSLSGTTTVYLCASAVFSLSTMDVGGTIIARRRR